MSKSVFESQNSQRKTDNRSDTQLFYENSITIIKKASKIASNNSNLQPDGVLLKQALYSQEPWRIPETHSNLPIFRKQHSTLLKSVIEKIYVLNNNSVIMLFFLPHFLGHTSQNLPKKTGIFDYLSFFKSPFPLGLEAFSIIIF
ncbi:hypothetical protein [Persicobacter diffluens]|uniref:Uncharacterized protein n=1 Tax=Persicobacter diffluens TaxID=981 RepID=A0AAN4W077_9BACT|nr:hypothetical protein PEDI_35450 [Persicobacter diffluens]